MNTLIMTVGLPRSGKSTYAKMLNRPIVSPDAIRLALHGQRFIALAEPVVWMTARLMVASLFEAGHDQVVLDACSITQKRRDEWEDPRWQTQCTYFYTTLNVCIDRAKKTGREDIIPIIESMAAQIDWPDAHGNLTRWWEQEGKL